MKHRDRGLNHRRTDCRPGFGCCPCPVCRYQWKVENAHYAACQKRGVPYEAPKMGSPVAGCCYVSRERIFAEEWEKENQPRPGLNYGLGILQDLMVTRRAATKGPAVPDLHNPFLWLRVAFVVTPRERVIVATIIQWLGTNVGFCWLRGVLDKRGYEVREKSRTDYSRPAKTAAVVLVCALALTACGGAVESFPLFYAGAKSIAKSHASSEHHPYANHRDPRVRAASRELQRVRDRCEWVETDDPMRVCAAPDDDDETAALARLEAALVAAKGRR